jgi:tetratricopeptide repeat protein 30
LNVSAIVLANLCVSYIMTSQNEEAEELMRKIEKEEEQLAYDDPDKKVYHLCIVNLVIGYEINALKNQTVVNYLCVQSFYRTLYCAKGNYEFGISRIIRSLEPFHKKLGIDTWFYAKRCFLSLLENLAKQTIVAKDSFLEECVQFFEQCEGENFSFVLLKHLKKKLLKTLAYGENVKTLVDQPLEDSNINWGQKTVAFEARHLKALLLRLQMY